MSGMINQPLSLDEGYCKSGTRSGMMCYIIQSKCFIISMCGKCSAAGFVILLFIDILPE